jgi:xanthine dehydrogenase accessory factor
VPIYERLAELEASGAPAAVATIVRHRGSVPRRSGTRMIVFPDGRIEGTVGGGEMEARVIAAARQAIQDQQTALVHYAFSDPEQGDPGACGGEIEVFVEPLSLNPTLVVVGGGHVGKAVAHLARWLGFQVVASDDRPAFCTPEAMPDASRHIVASLAQLPEQMVIDANTYVVLSTRGVPIDVEGLPALLDTPAAYLGVIGSRRRWETTRQELADLGIPAEKLERVTSPMGLELNAETPEEIALSILAQIVQLRRGGTGASMAQPARAGSRKKE